MMNLTSNIYIVYLVKHLALDQPWVSKVTFSVIIICKRFPYFASIMNLFLTSRRKFSCLGATSFSLAYHILTCCKKKTIV